MSQDQLNRYVFENADVRGELVQLEQSYQQIIQSHDYPVVIKTLLGELLAATSLLTATLKFRGDIGIQLQGNGPVSVAVINGNDQHQMRGVARFDGELADDASLADLFGNGYMVITLTPEEGERYQGVVALDKPTLAECVESYFQQSEQLATKLWLFADGKEKAAGMFLQILPSQAEATQESEAFEHLAQLTATIKAEEIFELDAETILHRLYHQEQVRLFDPISVSFKCTCSRERTASAIRTVAREEVDSILEEFGDVTMDCEYCNARYVFDAVDIASIFADQGVPVQNGASH